MLTKAFRRAFPARPGWRARWILLPILSALLLLASQRPAQAQLTRVPQVAVLDFYNPAEPNGGILARQATDAVVVEMTRTGRFDVIPRAQVVQQVQEMGLNLPLDEIGMRKLGEALGVDYVATGTVVSGSVGENPREARVTLAVVLTDVASGEPANGALTVGVTAAPAGADPANAAQAATLSALQNAAFSALGEINRYQLPEATVLITRDDTVLLNQGSRGGIRPGMEFVIFRGDQRVGRVRVTEVTTQWATTVMTDRGRGIRPEDRARAVFSLGDYVSDRR